MARPFPTDPQSCDGKGHTLLRDSDPMHLVQILPQQRSRPDRSVVAQFAGIGVDDVSDERIDDPQCRGGTALARSIRQTRPKIKSLTLLKTSRPVVDRLATDMKQFGDLIRRLALSKPEHGQGTAAFPRRGSMEYEVLQLDPLSAAEYDRSHRGTPGSSLVSRWAFYLSKNFCLLSRICGCVLARVGCQGCVTGPVSPRARSENRMTFLSPVSPCC